MDLGGRSTRRCSRATRSHLAAQPRPSPPRERRRCGCGFASPMRRRSPVCRGSCSTTLAPTAPRPVRAHAARAVPRRPEPSSPMTVDGPLRILAVISSPTDLHELDVEAEWQRPRRGAGAARRYRAGGPRPPGSRPPELGAGCGKHDDPRDPLRRARRLRRRLVRGSSTSRTSTAALAVTSSVLGPYPPTTTLCGWSCSTPAARRAATPSTPSAGWRRAWSSRTTAVVAMQFPITTERPSRSPASSTALSPTACPRPGRQQRAQGLAASDEWSTPVLFMRSPTGASSRTCTPWKDPYPPHPETPEPPAEPRARAAIEPLSPRNPDPRRAHRLAGREAAPWRRGGVVVAATPARWRRDEKTEGRAPSASCPHCGGRRSCRLPRGTARDAPNSSPGHQRVAARLASTATMVYSRENGNTSTVYVAAADGSNHRELFDQQTPEEFRESSGRPPGSRTPTTW